VEVGAALVQHSHGGGASTCTLRGGGSEVGCRAVNSHAVEVSALGLQQSNDRPLRALWGSGEL